MKVGKCTKKYAVLKCRVAVVCYVRGIRLFSVPSTQEREARETREAREGKKLKLFTNFLLAFVRLWHFSGFT